MASRRQSEGGGHGGGAGEDVRLPGLPRYLRINTLKLAWGAAQKGLKTTGHIYCPDPRHPNNRSYSRDPDVPDLLVFKPKGQSDVSRIPMVASGHLVVQQKASCYPAIALQPPVGAHVIDACAAPGNKTSHVAALVQSEGRVFAFEQNARRAALLKDMMAVKGADGIVETRHQSFLDADPNDPTFGLVTHVLLDPSCSSSGMSTAPRDTAEELVELADAQLALVLHAMRFPSVEAICYSTCSIHEAENEQVVRRVLAQQSDFSLAVAMPWWHRRGRVLDDHDDDAQAAEIARCVVRTAYPNDGTIGFFLARFERNGIGADGGDGGGGASVGGGHATFDSSEFEAKLKVLERRRLKDQKRAARAGGDAAGDGESSRTSDGGGGAASSRSDGGGGGSGGGSGARGDSIPEWRRLRDEQKGGKSKKGKRKRPPGEDGRCEPSPYLHAHQRNHLGPDHHMRSSDGDPWYGTVHGPPTNRSAHHTMGPT